MMKYYWFGFVMVNIAGFLVLGWSGIRIGEGKPPIPDKVVTPGGQVLIGPDEISDGQNVWQSLGGMELGSVWGHGSYVAPDWSADWLHRECMFILDAWSTGKFGVRYDSLSHEAAASLRARLVSLMRTNGYDPSKGVLVIDSIRGAALRANGEHIAQVFSKGNTAYAIPSGALTDSVELRRLAVFFFWTSWATSTNRPGSEVTYTNNWPHEDLIDNRPAADAIVWTGVSIILLLGGIGVMVWYHASRDPGSGHVVPPGDDPLFAVENTASQAATVKYFFTVTGLLLVQVILGVITAHYGIEGNGFYGIPLSRWLPFVLTRTWHTQIGIFWIATAWLAAGLYIAPAVSGVELRGQRLGVNALFGALLIVVFGSLIGEYLSVNRKLGGDTWFYFGHQGLEYVDLGRVWQIGLAIGLLLWVYLIGRNILVAIRKNDEFKPLLTLFLISAVAIGGLYLAGLMWGQHTNLAVMEYWRWWVVHLWVEGFFEVFATVVIIFMFARLRLIRLSTANAAVIFSSTVYLAGGIIGTLHHLYFSGTPSMILALGAVFSALEVVPLVLTGFEAWENLRLARSTDWAAKYKWPIYFFVAVAFWNMVGAGLFGFMINPPVALYYMQGLNTTPVHAHAALFGVYGMLGIGLMLFCLRVLWVNASWNDRFLRYAFWSLNVGLMAMVGGSLLPAGLVQTWASVRYGYWYARSAEFLYSPTMEWIKVSRALGDTVFAFGVLALVFFVVGLLTGWSFTKESSKKQAASNLQV